MALLPCLKRGIYMIIEIPYGKESVRLNIKEENVAEIVRPKKVKIGNENEIITNALENPVKAPPFQTFLKGVKSLLIIVNDATRPTPTAKILKILYPKIRDLEIKFIVACGSHRPPTEEEKQGIFGELFLEIKDNILIHEAKKFEEMKYIGKSSRGTEIYINKIVESVDKIIVINSVEPHYFAGYTGGRKSFVPGISYYETIKQNHKNALKIKSRTLGLIGNPVHEDMEEITKIIIKNLNKEVFALNVVLDAEHKIYSLASGDIFESFYESTKSADEIFAVKIEKKADIVLTVAPFPMDIDLYQSQKALENGKLALNDNGIIILVSKCRMGIGNPEFVKVLKSKETPEGVFDVISKGYKLGWHKAGKIAEIAIRANIWAVTDLDDASLDSIFIKPFHHIQQAVDAAIKEKEGGKVLFLMNGSITVPRL